MILFLFIILKFLKVLFNYKILLENIEPIKELTNISASPKTYYEMLFNEL